jgi:hypothetical protein
MTRLTLIALLSLAGTAFASDEYRIDDGAPEQNFGLGGGGGGVRSFAWLNRFIIEPGQETITAINVAMGNIPNGTTATAYLWLDPDQDGDPDNAVVVSSLTQSITNANPGTPVGKDHFDIPDATLQVGDIVFAGVIMDILPTDRPGRLDIDGSDAGIPYLPMGHAFVAGDTVSSIGPNNLGNAQLPVAPITAAFGFDGNWIVRLDASSLIPPCPTDITQDGVTDAADLARLIAVWGSGLIDFDGDGATNAADLAALLAAWGPCP